MFVHAWSREVRRGKANTLVGRQFRQILSARGIRLVAASTDVVEGQERMVEKMQPKPFHNISSHGERADKGQGIDQDLSLYSENCLITHAENRSV